MAWEGHSSEPILVVGGINFSSGIDSRHMLCRIQQVIIVEGTFSTDSSSLSSRHLHLPFNSPNACSTITLALLSDLSKSLTVGHSSGLRKRLHAPGCQFISWVSNYKWPTCVPPIRRIGECKISPFSIAVSSELIRRTRAS